MRLAICRLHAVGWVFHYSGNMNESGGERELHEDRDKRVLVVADDAELASKLPRLVEIAGGRPFLATTRAALREAVAAYMPFDLVVTELIMSWITGLGVVHACVFDEPVPVVFVAPQGLNLGQPTAASWVRVVRKPLVAEECIATFTQSLSDAKRSGVHRVG